MNLIRTTIEDAAVSVAVSGDPTSLSAFLQPGTAAAIWQRQTPQAIQTWLNEVSTEVLPSGRVALPIDAVASTVEHLFDVSGLPAGPERDWLRTDIVSLAGTFADLLKTKFLRLRLEPVTTNACRKFHIDAITARLICTYRGTGTQYGISIDGDDPKRVFTLPTGAPILLRGTLWPGESKSGLLHRSPPIEGTGETRFVLVLDPIFDPEDEE